MWGPHQRMAELWIKQKKKPLTQEELDEMSICLEANAKRAWKLATLENLSLVASMTNDTEWQHEICRQIEELKV
jgi:hypothetical protein